MQEGKQLPQLSPRMENLEDAGVLPSFSLICNQNVNNNNNNNNTTDIPNISSNNNNNDNNNNDIITTMNENEFPNTHQINFNQNSYRVETDEDVINTMPENQRTRENTSHNRGYEHPHGHHQQHNQVLGASSLSSPPVCRTMRKSKSKIKIQNRILTMTRTTYFTTFARRRLLSQNLTSPSLHSTSTHRHRNNVNDDNLHTTANNNNNNSSSGVIHSVIDTNNNNNNNNINMNNNNNVNNVIRNDNQSNFRVEGEEGEWRPVLSSIFKQRISVDIEAIMNTPHTRIELNDERSNV